MAMDIRQGPPDHATGLNAHLRWIALRDLVESAGDPTLGWER